MPQDGPVVAPTGACAALSSPGRVTSPPGGDRRAWAKSGPWAPYRTPSRSPPRLVARLRNRFRQIFLKRFTSVDPLSAFPAFVALRPWPRGGRSCRLESSLGRPPPCRKPPVCGRSPWSSSPPVCNPARGKPPPFAGARPQGRGRKEPKHSPGPSWGSPTGRRRVMSALFPVRNVKLEIRSSCTDRLGLGHCAAGHVQQAARFVAGSA